LTASLVNAETGAVVVENLTAPRHDAGMSIPYWPFRVEVSEIGRRTRPGTWIWGKRCTICQRSVVESDDDDEQEEMSGESDANPTAPSPVVRNVRRVITRSS
ncbi:MAG: hypothetical protein EBY96_07335, partial [Actinobacteria bacterium]|nr:hypothetical protein [Actinomycetota bacterium]